MIRRRAPAWIEALVVTALLVLNGWLYLERLPERVICRPTDGHFSRALHYYDHLLRGEAPMPAPPLRFQGDDKIVDMESNWQWIQPPLQYAWTARVFGILGPSLESALRGQLVFHLLLLLALYGIGRQLAGFSGGLVALALACSSPFLAYYARFYAPDFTGTTFVAVSLYALLHSNRLRDRRWSLGFGFTCGLIALTRWFYLFYPLAGAVWAVGAEALDARRSDDGRPRDALRNGALALGLATLVAAPWYATHHASFMLKASQQMRGAGAPSPPWLTSAVALSGLLRFAFYQAPLLLAVSLAGVWTSRRADDRRFAGLALFVLAGSVVSGVVMVTGVAFFINYPWRYVLPLLVFLIPLATLWVNSVGRWAGPLAVMLLALCLLSPMAGILISRDNPIYYPDRYWRDGEDRPERHFMSSSLQTEILTRPFDEILDPGFDMGAVARVLRVDPKRRWSTVCLLGDKTDFLNEVTISEAYKIGKRIEPYSVERVDNVLIMHAPGTDHQEVLRHMFGTRLQVLETHEFEGTDPRYVLTVCAVRPIADGGDKSHGWPGEAMRGR